MGRLTIPLLWAGWRVIGLDASAVMLAALRNRVGDEFGDNAALVLKHARLEDAGALEAHAAVATDDFLTHFLTLERLQEALIAIKRLLLPGRRCVTDLRPRLRARLRAAQAPGPKALQAFGVTQGVRIGDCECSVAVIGWDEYDPTARILISHQQFTRLNWDGQVIGSELKTIRQRLHTLAELREAGRQCGLLVETAGELEPIVHGDWESGHLVSLTSKR